MDYQKTGCRVSSIRQMYILRCVSFTCTLVGIAGCSLSELVKSDPPTQGAVVDQSTVQSYSGALGMYYATIGQMAVAMSEYIRQTGLFTDELILDGATVTDATSSADQRMFSDESGISVDVYQNLQKARILAQQARGALLKFGTASSNALVGEMYALEGYSEVMLAELYCSGIPLSTYYYGDDVRYSRGYTTSEVFSQALVHFDSAISYGKDSVPVMTLASVGKARTLLNLGHYDSAVLSVQHVATDAVYALRYSTTSTATRFWAWDPGPNGGPNGSNEASLMSYEGGNGLDWLAAEPSRQDPRVPVTTTTTSPVQFTIPPRQKKYDGNASVRIASGIEARLMEAEQQLKQSGSVNNGWLQTLNTLRSTLRTSSGGRMLPDTTDPVTNNARVDLLFRERGFWLYLNGTRQGDLRRLIKQYGRVQSAVYPAGEYAPWTGLVRLYGHSVTVGVPASERERNSLYRGCIDRNA